MSFFWFVDSLRDHLSDLMGPVCIRGHYELTPLTETLINIYFHRRCRRLCLPTRISNYIHYKVWDEITYRFTTVNGAAVEVWKWINNFIPHLTGHVLSYPGQEYFVSDLQWKTAFGECLIRRYRPYLSTILRHPNLIYRFGIDIKIDRYL